MTKLCAAMVSAAMTLTLGCDAPLADREELLAVLAEDDLDPEVREHVEAMVAEEAEEAMAGLDELAAPADEGEGLSCFFCPPPPPSDPATYTPVVLNPYVQANQQGNAILFMQSASSFIVLPGATLSLQVPFSPQTFGPFALQFDMSGTQIRANVTGAFPVGSCRTITVTNPNQRTSSPVSLCR